MSAIKQTPSVVSYRGNHPETYHALDWVITDEHGQIVEGTVENIESSPSTWARSTLKPFQAFISTQLLPNLTLQQVAVITASHAGLEVHCTEISNLLGQFGLSVDSLQCGLAYPVDELSRQRLVRDQKPKIALYHNCSGKHSGLLCACKQLGYSIENYLKPEHPLQQAILTEIKRYVPSLNQSDIAQDGCGLPVYHLKLSTVAKMYANLVANTQYDLISQAMMTYPDLLGGPLRIDSNIMRVSGGNLLAKVGAEGLIAVSNKQLKQGLVLKIWDGNQRIRDTAILALLEKIGWLLATAVNDIKQVNPTFTTERFNDDGIRIGHLKFYL